MNSLDKIHARSLMSSHVVKLAPDLPIPRALELFEDHKISGAPVVDASGRVLGVLSASDVAQAERLGRSAVRAQTPALVMRDGDDESDDELAEEDLLSIEEYGPESAEVPTVRDWMNPEVISVRPGCTLPELCRKLAENRIHRVLVMEGGELQGIVTTSDVVRWVATN